VREKVRERVRDGKRSRFVVECFEEEKAREEKRRHGYGYGNGKQRSMARVKVVAGESSGLKWAGGRQVTFLVSCPRVKVLL
jgi:hypothetical protein